jgi:hypothetical protein
MDSVIPIVVSAFGGAAVTAIVGVVTFVWTGHREHRRWLYEIKYQNYLEVLRIWGSWTRMSKPGMSKKDYVQLDPIFIKITELTSADLVLVNSKRVDRTFSKLLRAMNSQFAEMKEDQRSDYDLHDEWLALVHDMRKDLNIRGQVEAGREPATERRSNAFLNLIQSRGK